MSQKQIIKSTDELVAIFHKCHNILRNNEGIVGLKALTEFSDLLFLKLLEPMIDNEEIKLPKYCKFSEFSKMPEEEMYEHVKNKVWQQLWKLVPDVYHGNYLEIKYPHTLKETIKVLDSVDFDSTATDIKGSAYEHFISRELVGKTLGQFFTPRQVVNEMIEYIKPKIHKDGTSETIYDPACGTGGFLVQAFNYLKVQKGVDLKWIQKNAVHGSEINSDTVRICKLNMLCAGDGKSNIVKRDSLRYCPEETYDIVLANPPFGIKGIKFDMLGVKYPIESNTAEFLFLENIVKVLKKGGRAAVIIPDGVLFKTGVGTKLREWFLKEVKLEKVVSLSSGTFDYAGVKTAILYFSKPKKTLEEGKFATDKIEFSSFGEKESTTLTLKEIEKKDYILLLKTHQTNEASEENKEKSFVKIGDYFDCKMGKPIKKEKRTGTKYPYYGANGPSGQFIDEFLFDGDYLVTAQDGSIGATHWVSGKFYPSNHTHVVKSKDEKKVLTKYLFYYLKKYDFTKLITGAVIPKLTQDALKKIEFPLIDIKEQEKFVEKMDFVYEQLNKSKVVVVENIQKEIKILVQESQLKNSELKSLKQLFKSLKSGDSIGKNDRSESMAYPFIGSGGQISKYSNFNAEGETIVIGRAGNPGSLQFFNEKICVSDNAFIGKVNENEVLPKYLYYLLTTIDFSPYVGGAVIPVIAGSKIMEIEVRVPDLTIQKQVLEKIEQKQKIVDLIKKDLMSNDN